MFLSGEHAVSWCTRMNRWINGWIHYKIDSNVHLSNGSSFDVTSDLGHLVAMNYLYLLLLKVKRTKKQREWWYYVHIQGRSFIRVASN